jgi:hypothetical protein
MGAACPNVELRDFTEGEEAPMSTMPDAIEIAKTELDELANCLRKAVGKVVASDATFADREVAALAVTNEVVRKMLEAELQQLSDGFGEQVRVDDVPYAEHLDGKVGYHSLCGRLWVRRSTYREVGVRNGPTIVPLALAAGLVERMTPALAQSVAVGYAKDDMRSHEENLRLARRVPPSRTAMEQAAKRVSRMAQRHQPRIEADVRRAEVLPDGAHAIHVGLDRTSVPMEEPAPRPAKPPRRRHNKPYVRKAPEPVTVNYRMAYIGTVSIVDQHGDALVTRKYAAPAADDPARIVARMVADVRRALQQNPSLSVGIVQDGAPEMWNLMRAGLNAEPTVTEYFEGIDRYHLVEHLAKALELVERDDAERKKILDGWRNDFEYRDSAIDSVEHLLQKRAGWITGANAEKLAEELVYLRNNKDRMRYVTLRNQGLPVGSGTTEGAGKSVINKRCKGSGQRWHDDGLRAALSLRSWYCSDRFPLAWSHLSRHYTAEVVID